MLKFMKNKLESIIWSLLAISIIVVPSVSFGMEEAAEYNANYDELAPQNPFRVVFEGFKDFFFQRNTTFVDPETGREIKAAQSFEEVKSTAAHVLPRLYKDTKEYVLNKGGLGENISLLKEVASAVKNGFKDDINKAQDTYTTISNAVDPKNVKKMIADKASEIKQDITSGVKANLFSTLNENKYYIAGGFIATIAISVLIGKITSNLYDKALSKDPKFLVTSQLLNITRDNFLFLNQDVAHEVANFVLLHKTISNSCLSDLGYKNLVLTGADNFVKTKIAESVARQSNVPLVKIDAHSMLFDQNISDDQKRILVRNFFDKISKSKTLVFVNLDHATLNQLENNGFNKIITDIANNAKTCSSKISFIFACPTINSEYSKLLDGCHDHIINIEKPDQNAREQIIKNLVDKTILNKNISLLEKLGIKSLVISQEKQDTFKAYLTNEKVDSIAKQLEGKSYVEVQNFVRHLRALLSQKIVAPVANYDFVINILLNKSDSNLSQNLLARAA